MAFDGIDMSLQALSDLLKDFSSSNDDILPDMDNV